MKKIDYIKHAWNMADNKVQDNLDKDPEKFMYALGIKAGLTIALRIMNSNWTDENIRAYIDRLSL